MEPLRADPPENIRINEILAHTDEPQVDYVELFNHSTNTVNLSGCVITDDPATNRFRIPNGISISPRGLIAFDQNQLGFRLNGWICAEDVRCYKPAPEFWTAVSSRRGVPFGRSWWHVSAYADYDMATAGRLGLTTVFIERNHNVWGPSTMTAPDLRALATMLAG